MKRHGTGPTEAEIRETLEDRAKRYGRSEHPEELLRQAIDKALDAIAYIEMDDEQRAVGATVISELWTDLRPSEALRLQELLHDARERLMAELLPRLVDVVVSAGLRFAEEFPDAPRAAQPDKVTRIEDAVMTLATR